MRTILLSIPDEYDLDALADVFVPTVDGKQVRLLTLIGADGLVSGRPIYISGLLTHYADKALKIKRPVLHWSAEKGWYVNDGT